MLIRWRAFFRSIAFYQQTSTQRSSPRRIVVTHALHTTRINLHRTHRAKMQGLKRVCYTRAGCWLASLTAMPVTRALKS